ncbi:MAG TPA: hypothetical protein VMV49_07090 [Candidatus Deferrimicrobium sp.]|nr:hypothetical protein [Candidatus Deferrimicrobium sp.]
MRFKKLIILVICILIVTSGILIFWGLQGGKDDDGPITYTCSLQLDDGAAFTIISGSFINCSKQTDTVGYPEYFILNVVRLEGPYEDPRWVNITFYSPAGFGEYDHIAFLDGENNWVSIPCNISDSGKNISATIDDLPSSTKWSVIRYPEVEIVLEAKRQDNQPITLNRTIDDQILLPLGMKNVIYYLELQATGGNGTYLCTLCCGDLPNGINISDDGILSGNATEFGNFVFGLCVNSSDRSTIEIFNLTLVDYIPNEMLPTNLTLPTVWIGEWMDAPIVIQMGGGNSGPYTIYNKSGELLPPGLSFTFWADNEYAYANITGKPTKSGLYYFTMAGYDEIYRIWGTNDPNIGNYIERQYQLWAQ